EMDYRKNQLKKLQEEVVDLEEMNSGISITDLGLNEFRMDLLEYISNNKDIAKKPNGLHSVVNSSDIEGLEKGVIFILKNINERINIDNKNQLHPFYLVYIKEDEELVSNHLNVKTTLDLLRMIGKKYNEPIVSAYTEFNEKTDDGKKMQQYSDLLNKAVDKIINVKEESDLESLFTSGGTSMSNTTITGVEDFELITFLVVI
ncbi:MAG: ATP-dependent helicase, partial [Peptostreptococcaceae bacterium]